MRNPHNDPLVSPATQAFSLSCAPAKAGAQDWDRHARGSGLLLSQERKLAGVPVANSELVRGAALRSGGRDALIQPCAVPFYAGRMTRTHLGFVGLDNLSQFPANFPAAEEPTGKIARELLGNMGVRHG